MKIIQTLVAKPLISMSQKGYHNLSFGLGGFSDKFTFYSMWINSFISLKERFGEVSLYGDDYAEYILIETLGLDYSSFTRIETTSFSNTSEGIWAWNKLKVYSMQKEPFLHFDGDFLLLNNLSDNFLKSDICFEFPHIIADRDLIEFLKIVQSLILKDDKLKKVYSFLLFDPDQLKLPIMYNFGVFGGNEVFCIEKYSLLAMQLAEYIWNKNIFKDYLMVNVLVEQVLLTRMVYFEHLSYSVLNNTQLDRERMLNSFLSNGFHNTHFHLLSYYKVLFKKYIEGYLFYEHPELYNRVRNLITIGKL
jgi:hypothetical protein